MYFVQSADSDVSNLQLPEPGLLLYYKDLDHRTLWLDTEVNDFTMYLGRHIIDWNREDKGKPIEDRIPIRIMFMSVGGDLSVNNSICDIISLSETPVIGVNCGIAYSAACFIYLACHKRYAFPNSEFLIHSGSGGFEGTYDQVVSAVVNYQNQVDKLASYIMDRTKITQEEIEQNFMSDWYVSSEEALDKGICEKLITSLDEII